MSPKWIISCEHGGNHIPPSYAPYFENAALVLQSHRGFDPGALELFQVLSKELADFSLFSQTSRLLVELNRSLHHKSLFSAYTKGIEPELKKEIIASYYLPYRRLIEEKIKEYQANEYPVIHLSIHSFTPELNGELRKADIGLLYDPSKETEKEFCRYWKRQLKQQAPQLNIRFNYPYLGKADGFTTYLRKRFPSNYTGIELEVNQKHAYQEEMNLVILRSLQELKKAYS